jgi:NAD(P)-dependent dehydrogenase (short-subunit alcohol dehydrogenase family)
MMKHTAGHELKGRCVIVTGGATSAGRVDSVGEATARLFAAEGASVVIVDRDGPGAEATREAILQAGGEAQAIEADLTDEDQCRRAVTRTVERWGRLDGLVNNVGIGAGRPVHLTEAADWDAAMAVNVKTALFMSKHAIPAMTAGGAVTMVSTTAIRTPAASAAYSATKAALEGLSRQIALQYGPDGVRCNAVRPGEVWTAMVDRHCDTEARAEALRAERARRTALRSEGDAWDIARLIVFLTGQGGRWITGQTLSVDGGAGLLRPNEDWTAHHSYWKADQARQP